MCVSDCFVNYSCVSLNLDYNSLIICGHRLPQPFFLKSCCENRCNGQGPLIKDFAKFSLSAVIIKTGLNLLLNECPELVLVKCRI